MKYVSKSIKKLAVLCTVCALIVCSAGNISVYAKGDASLSAANVSVEAGDTVSVNIVLNGNPGIWGIKFRVGYDHSAFKLEAINNGNIFSDGDVTLPKTLDEEQFVYIASSNALKDITTNGTIVTLKFKTETNAKSNTYPITVSLTQSINVDGKEIDVSTGNGSVAVVKCVHNKVWKTTNAAGCETTGTESETCSKCSETFSTRTVKATGHIHTEVRNSVAAKVTATGYSGDIYCNDCGKLITKGKTTKKLTKNVKTTETEYDGLSQDEQVSSDNSSSDIKGNDETEAVSANEKSNADSTDTSNSNPHATKGFNFVPIIIIAIACLVVVGTISYIIIRKRRK